MQHDGAPGADRILILEIAAAAPADPRSVAKFLRGEPVRGMTADRIRRAIERSGRAGGVGR